MSRVNRRSSPSPRWRTSSGSSGPRNPQASQLLVHRGSFKDTGPSDFPPDNYHQRRFPLPSHRLEFPADIARQRSSFQAVSSSPQRNFQSERQPSLSSKNRKYVEAGSFSKTYYKPLRDNTTRPASPPSKFQAVLKNNKSKRYFSGMKRPSELRDFADFPPAKQEKRNMEDRHDVSYQSRSSQLSNSNVLWCSPPCRQRTRSRERKSDSVLQGSHTEKSCPDRDSSLNQRRARMNLKTPCQVGDGRDMLDSKDSRGQHPTSWRRFPSDKLSDNLEISHTWSGVQHSPPRLHKKSGEGTTRHLERINSSESRKNSQHSNCADQSPKLQYKLRNTNEISSTQSHRFQENNYHHQRQNSSAISNRRTEDDHRRQGTSFSSERDSCQKTETRKLQRRRGSSERNSRDNIRQESRNSARNRRSSSIESFSEVDCSWPNIAPQERSRSQSSRSVKGRRSHSVDRVTSTPSDRSVDGSRSVDSPLSSSDVKAKVPDFNPDYVVIIRRRSEGARPLCMREEFSGKSSQLVNSDERLSVAAQNFNSVDRSTSSMMVLFDKRQKDDCSNSEFSPAVEESSIKSTKVTHKVEEKAEKVMNTKLVTATYRKPSRTVTNTRSVLTEKDVADERFVRARPDSVGEQRDREQTALASKSAEEEASLTSKKNAFDLRQKIAERRQLRTGKNTSTKIVRSWPNRWINVPQTNFRNLVCGGSRATERKHSFAPQKKGPRRSVMLK